MEMQFEQLIATGDTLALAMRIADFNFAYAEALDEGRLQHWPTFFSKDAVYKVTARENHDQGLPVGLVYCEGLAMIRDRALAIDTTAMFAPRYLRHYITNVRVLGVKDNEIEACANYLLMQTLHDEPQTKTHQVGRYLDRFVVEEGELKLKRRICVYDNLLLDNSLVYPV